MRPRGVGGLELAFVGRNAEFEQLQAAYDRVAEEGRPHLVTVLGEAGVGKTRLVREFWLWLGALSPEPLRRTGRCQPHGRATTYWPLGEILKEHFGMSERDAPDAVLARLGSREILGLTLGLDVAAGIHPLVARDRLHDAWVEFLMDLADEQPAVILLEDLHWGNNDLLDLLESLLEGVHGPMLLLCTARPELLDARPGWGGARRAGSTLMLESLSRADSSHLVQALLASDVPPQLDTVVDLGEGNPFFIEELLGATDRPGPAGIGQRGLDPSRATSGNRAPRLRAGPRVGEDRSARRGREGGPPGRVRDRPGLLDRADL